MVRIGNLLLRCLEDRVFEERLGGFIGFVFRSFQYPIFDGEVLSHKPAAASVSGMTL